MNARLFGVLLLALGCGLSLWAQGGVDRTTLAILVNDADPLSVQVGQYYQQARKLEARQVIHLNFPAGKSRLSPEAFAAIRAQIERATPDFIQAYAITWSRPYRVGCMSITTAVAAGFDAAFCPPEGVVCAPTRRLDYFDSAVTDPHRQLGLRPAMMLAGNNLEEVKRLIDRGIAADGSHPAGSAYLLVTADRARSVRALGYGEVFRVARPPIRPRRIEADWIEHEQDVLFYFTGTAWVRQLDSIRFLPGAVGDHLTSAGGQLDGQKQMPALAWLSAGATGSYGTVSEPCNFPEKFPRPAVLIDHYQRGETLLEAYWKSVASPGQGLFIGEPLARPFGER